MLNVRLAGDHLFGKLLFTWLSLVMSMLVSFVLSFFPRDVLDEILNLIGSVSEGFPSYFDRVWHAALWATMRKYNISANLVRTIEQLYDKATSAVQVNGSIGEWFRTTVGVRQGCLLSPTFFNIFLERIMSDALEEHDGKVSIGRRNITNLRFADDIAAPAEEEQELEALVESHDKTCTRYKMGISAEKTKLMTNSANGIQTEIKVKGQKLGTVTSFKSGVCR